MIETRQSGGGRENRKKLGRHSWCNQPEHFLFTPEGTNSQSFKGMNNETKLYRFAQSFLLALRLLQLILGDCSVAHDPCSKIQPVAAVQYKHQDNWYPAKWRLMTSLKKNKTSKTRQQQQHVSISNRKDPNLLPFREDAACVLLRARACVCVWAGGGSFAMRDHSVAKRHTPSE